MTIPNIHAVHTARKLASYRHPVRTATIENTHLLGGAVYDIPFGIFARFNGKIGAYQFF